MSWARERLGYFAYCGSEPMMVDFWSEMGFDVQRMMYCRSERGLPVTGYIYITERLHITTYKMICQRD